MTTSKEIDKFIKLKMLTENDIIELMNLSTSEMFLLMKTQRNFKQQALINIYWNPTLLYDCKILSERVIEKLISFIEYRYNVEKYEMEERLENGYASKAEFDEYLVNLDKHFFPESSIIAKNIKRIIFSKNEKTYKL